MLKKNRNTARCSPGFTLVDLMAVVAMVILLMILLAPVLARTRPNNQVAQCLSNERRLTTAWQMYNADNNSKLPPNLHGGEAVGGYGDPILGVGWAEGWLDWTLSTDNTNVDFLLTPRYARLAPYFDPDATNVFRCPADNYLSSVQRAGGWTRRCRSYSLSMSIGPGNAISGPWDNFYRQITKDTDFLYPTPAETLLFIDEHPDSMNDPGIFSPHQTSWPDLPTTLHNGAAAASFADGHAELHKWTDSLTRLKSVQFTFTAPTPSIGDRDIHWLSYHTARVSTNSY